MASRTAKGVAIPSPRVEESVSHWSSLDGSEIHFECTYIMQSSPYLHTYNSLLRNISSSQLSFVASLFFVCRIGVAYFEWYTRMFILNLKMQKIMWDIVSMGLQNAPDGYIFFMKGDLF